MALYVTLSSSTVPRAQVMTHFLYDPHQGANHGANFGPLSSALLLDLINVILRQCPTSSGHLPANFAALGPFSCVPTHCWDVQCLPLIIHSASRAECNGPARPKRAPASGWCGLFSCHVRTSMQTWTTFASNYFATTTAVLVG